MKKYLISVLALAAFSQCGNDGLKNSISGTVKGAEGKTIYLERQLNEKYVRTDSTTIGSDGSFTLRASQPLELNFYKITVDEKHYAVVITDSSEALKLDSQLDNMKLGSKAQGSVHTEALYDFYESMKPYISRFDTLRKKAADPMLTQEAKGQLSNEYVAAQKEKSDYCKQWLESNSKSPAALAALSELDIRAELETYKKVMSELEPTFGQTNFFRQLQMQVKTQEAVAAQQAQVPQPGDPQKPIDVDKNEMNTPEFQQKIKEMQQQQMQQQQQQAAMGPIKIGMQAPEIAQKDPEGSLRKLSSLKGKVVLIDFWASWCGPCRRENPHVVAAYNKYKSKGFEVFSVSLDNTPDKWKAAIAQDGLIWKNHVSDLAGWNSVVARDYGVHSIPFPVLIDKNGKVVQFGNNIRGQLLEAELAKLMGS